MTPAMLAEDAAEAANKDVRFIEEHRAFQSSDIRVLSDTFRKLLRRSDPIIQARISYPDTYTLGAKYSCFLRGVYYHKNKQGFSIPPK